MTATTRWFLVALGVILIISVPLVIRAIPPQDSDIDAATLARQVEASAGVPYSGYVEAQGTLQLPVASELAELGPLFGERTRMRVWWRSPEQWRVDNILTTGETDLIHNAVGTIMWEYEDDQVTSLEDSGIRLPRTSDLIPPELARWLLEDVEETDLARIPPARIAGHDALGLRVTTASNQSSIDHVDIWVDPTTGLALRLSIYGKGETLPALTSSFMQLSLDVPSSADTTFHTPPGADFTRSDVVDIADAANQFAPFVPPRQLDGLKRVENPELHAVGIYGTGLTQMVAIPLWDRAAGPLRTQLKATPTAKTTEEGVTIAVGPLTMLLTRFPDDDGGWLLAGTVTEQTLLQSAHALEHAQQVEQPRFQ
ncbi:MAG: hypothetical protein ABI586_00805 [Candidatus Nanopelagicales bacterium]